MHGHCLEYLVVLGLAAKTWAMEGAPAPSSEPPGVEQCSVRASSGNLYLGHHWVGRAVAIGAMGRGGG